MDENAWLAQRFEENRVHRRAVAYRMPGSEAEADDAVQESWPRLSRSGTGGVHNRRAWLATVVAQMCRWTCFAAAPLCCRRLCADQGVGIWARAPRRS